MKRLLNIPRTAMRKPTARWMVVDSDGDQRPRGHWFATEQEARDHTTRICIAAPYRIYRCEEVR